MNKQEARAAKLKKLGITENDMQALTLLDESDESDELAGNVTDFDSMDLSDLDDISTEAVEKFLEDDEAYNTNFGASIRNAKELGEVVVLPAEMLEGRSKSYVARLKTAMLQFALNKLLGGGKAIPVKAPWRSKINALGILGIAVAWAMPKISLLSGVPIEQLYEVFGTLFGGLLITLRTWFTTKLLHPSARKKGG